MDPTCRCAVDQAQLTSVLAVVLSRATERILLVLVGALALYLGYRLFRHMPTADKGSGKLELPGGVSIFLSRIGPGVFFALFGVAVIGYSVAQPIQFTLPTSAGSAAYSGLGQRDLPAAASQPSFAAGPGPNAETVIAKLNGVLQDARKRLDAPAAAELEGAIRGAKFAVMLRGWKPEWGDRAAFERWV